MKTKKELIKIIECLKCALDNNNLIIFGLKDSQDIYLSPESKKLKRKFIKILNNDIESIEIELLIRKYELEN